MAKSKKTDADTMFQTDIKVTDFAAGLAKLPQLGDMLRLAGLQDARTMASVKITSSRINAIRAKALGNPRALKRARQGEGQAASLATALEREETRVRPVTETIGDLAGMAGGLADLAGKFRLHGKVLDASGKPIPNAVVEVAGKDTGVLFTAQTDKEGAYDLSMAVGAGADQADEGEGLLAAIKLDGQILKAAVGGLIKEGGMLHKIMTVPPIKTITDLAAPIAADRPVAEAEVKPSKSPKLTDLQEQPGKGQTGTPGKPKAEVPKPFKAEGAVPSKPKAEVATPTKPKVEVATPAKPKVEGATPVKPKPAVATPAKPAAEVRTPAPKKPATPRKPKETKPKTPEKPVVATPKKPRKRKAAARKATTPGAAVRAKAKAAQRKTKK